MPAATLHEYHSEGTRSLGPMFGSGRGNVAVMVTRANGCLTCAVKEPFTSVIDHQTNRRPAAAAQVGMPHLLGAAQHISD